MVGRGQEPRSALLQNYGEGDIYPFCSKMAKVELLETVWKLAGGFLIACVWCFKRARWDIFAFSWLLATLRIEAYSDFPDSLSTLDFSHF